MVHDWQLLNVGTEIQRSYMIFKGRKENSGKLNPEFPVSSYCDH